MQALGLVWGEVNNRASDCRERSTLLEEPAHPGARQTFAVWKSRTKNSGFVVGRDVPSRKLSSVLRNLAVYEPLQNGNDYRVRIAGTAFYRRFGRDVTGERLSDLLQGTDFAATCSLLADVVESGQPLFIDVERAHGSRPPVRFEGAFLPVLAPDRSPGWILAGLFFQDWVY